MAQNIQAEMRKFAVFPICLKRCKRYKAKWHRTEKTQKWWKMKRITGKYFDSENGCWNSHRRFTNGCLIPFTNRTYPGRLQHRNLNPSLYIWVGSIQSKSEIPTKLSSSVKMAAIAWQNTNTKIYFHFSAAQHTIRPLLIDCLWHTEFLFHVKCP